MEFGKSENLPFVGIKNTHTQLVSVKLEHHHTLCFSHFPTVFLYFLDTPLHILLFSFSNPPLYLLLLLLLLFEASDTDIWLSGSESYLGSMRGSRRIRNLGS